MLCNVWTWQFRVSFLLLCFFWIFHSHVVLILHCTVILIFKLFKCTYKVGHYLFLIISYVINSVTHCKSSYCIIWTFIKSENYSWWLLINTCNVYLQHLMLLNCLLQHIFVVATFNINFCAHFNHFMNLQLCNVFVTPFALFSTPNSSWFFTQFSTLFHLQCPSSLILYIHQ